MIHHRPVLRHVVVAVLLPVALLSGCGSDDSGSTTTTSGAESAGEEEAATKVPDLCEVLTADQVGQAVGATVTLEKGPSGDCEFGQEDPRALSGSVGVLPDADVNGGYDGYKSGSAATLTDGQTAEISGVGDQAFLVTGTIGGGESLQGGGAAAVGQQVVTVNLSSPPGTSADQLVTVATALLRLGVDAF